MIAQGGIADRLSDGVERRRLAEKFRSRFHYESEPGSSISGHVPALAFIASSEQAMRELWVRLMECQEVAAPFAAEETTWSRSTNGIVKSRNRRTQVSLLNRRPTS